MNCLMKIRIMWVRQLWIAKKEKKEPLLSGQHLTVFRKKSARVQHSHRSTEPRNVMSNDIQFIAIGAAHTRWQGKCVHTLYLNCHIWWIEVCVWVQIVRIWNISNMLKVSYLRQAFLSIIVCIGPLIKLFLELNKNAPSLHFVEHY